MQMQPTFTPFCHVIFKKTFEGFIHCSYSFLIFSCKLIIFQLNLFNKLQVKANYKVQVKFQVIIIILNKISIINFNFLLHP